MLLQNPTNLSNATRFRPYQEEGGSRSPSRSPYRKTRFTAQELDPLLDNLSPDATLHALSSADAVTSIATKDQDVLTRSIAEASTAERALGIRAAFAAQKLKQWHKELSAWDWPAREDRALGKGFQTPDEDGSNLKDGNGLQERYLGCLPATVVEGYEGRLEQIQDGMEDLQVEELKEHVLNAHIPAKRRTLSGRSPVASPTKTFNYVQLGDLTAVITATIIQALPFLARLSSLLSSWDIRLSALRQTPDLLKKLQHMQDAIEGAFASIEASPSSILFTRAQFESSKAKLGSEIQVLGAVFDKMLDLLEGTEDSLPSTWIDQMDNTETDFADWVVEAERLVSFNEWNGDYEPSHVNGRSKSLLGESPAPPLPLPARSPLRSCRPSTFDSYDISKVNKSIATESQPFENVVTSSPTGSLNVIPVAEMVPGVVSTQDRVSAQESSPSGPKSSACLNGVAHVQMPEQRASLSDFTAAQDKTDAELFSDSYTPSRASPQKELSSPISPSQPLTPQEPVLEEMRKQITTPVRPLPPGPESDESSKIVVAGRVEVESATSETISTPIKEGHKSLGFYKPTKQDFDIGHLASTPTQKTPFFLSPTDSVFESSASPRELVDHGDGSATAEEKARQSISESRLVADKSSPSTSPFKEPFHFPVHPQRSGMRDSPAKPPPLQLPHSNHRREVSEISVADSMVSDTFSDISNAEIVDARTEVLGTPTINVVDNPFRASRDNVNGSKPRVQSMHLPETLNFALDPPPRTQRTKSLTLSSMVLQSPASDDRPSLQTLGLKTSHADEDDGLSDTEGMRPTIVHRASMSSMELISRNQVRRIVVSRQSSRSSAIFLGSDGKGGPAEALKALTGSESVRTASPVEFERRMTPTPIQRTHSGLSFDQLSDHDELSPVVRTTSSQRTGSFQSNSPISPTLRGRASMRISHGPSNLNSPVAFSSPASSPPLSPGEVIRGSFFEAVSDAEIHDESLPSIKRSISNGDSLEARIQDLLTTLPTLIRLTSNADSSDNLPQPSTSTAVTSQAPGPSLTLSPAEPDRNIRRPNSTTTDVRVYHLTCNDQSRATPPTRLLVRLVGENGERVMVRVGGGWADLGEYLREYSMHHGKGSISDGRMEVSNLVYGGRGGKWESVSASSPMLPGLSKARSRSPTSQAGSKPGFMSSHGPEDKQALADTPVSMQTKSADSESNNPSVTWTSPSTTTSWAPVQNNSDFLTPTRTTVTTARSRGPPFTSRVLETPNSSPAERVYSTNSTAPASNQKYTPLGAAGPKGVILPTAKMVDKKKGVERGMTPTQEGEKMTEGFNGSAGNETTEYVTRTVTSTTTNSTALPTTTTTTTITTNNPPSANRGPAAAAIKAPPPSPNQNPKASANKSMEKRKSTNRLSSLGDVGGIRRVFLRKKDR